MNQTLRAADTRGENAVAAYLDKCFYPFHCKNVTRTLDKEAQIAGEDIVFDFEEITNMVTDEKAMLHYVNKNLPTFAFELSFINRSGELAQGWLFDYTKRTQYYLLTWITAKQEKNISPEDITSLEVLLISRRAIIEMLAAHGYDKEQILQRAASIRKNKEFRVSGKVPAQPFYFFFTEFLSEKPINVVIHKNQLIKLATAHFPAVTPQ